MPTKNFRQNKPRFSNKTVIVTTLVKTNCYQQPYQLSYFIVLKHLNILVVFNNY